MKIRVVKTASQASAVQVVRYRKGKRITLQHIGSAHNGVELEELMVVAQEWIKDYSKQLSVFPDESPNKLLLLNHCTFGILQYFTGIEADVLAIAIAFSWFSAIPQSFHEILHAYRLCAMILDFFRSK